VGNHVIHLGTFEDYEGKLSNLSAFYEKVLPEVGWNKLFPYQSGVQGSDCM
jgi:hypothetical protein